MDAKFPAAMKYHDAERGIVAKLGGIPPIRLIPTVDEDKDSQPSVTIKLAEKNQGDVHEVRRRHA